jgi:hypothetical protein
MTGRPEEVILIVACRLEGVKHHFLFGIKGEQYINAKKPFT